MGKDIRYRPPILKGICLLALFLCFGSSFSQMEKNIWLQKLVAETAQSTHYDAAKVKRIDSLQQQMGSMTGKDLFFHYLNLFNEYEAFNFDSAYFYARKLFVTALQLNEPLLAKYADIKINTVLLSSGMFKEVFDSLDDLDPRGLNDREKAEYYALKARSYSDLVDYNRDNIFSALYNNRADSYIDSCLILATPGSFQYLYFNGLRDIRAGDILKATAYFSQLIHSPALSLRQQAIVYSTFSDVYIRREMTDSAIILLAKAAIADIQSSTRETTAILHLASLLFRQGDVENASVFIQKASTDARSFGARQRLVQLSTILPVIEAERIAVAEREKSSISRYAFAITFLFLALIALSVIVIRQVRQLKKQQKEIRQQNTNLQRLVEEKEWLLKEIHHRVKNNLHTITSLLESQSAYLQDEALQAVRNSQHRVYAMSLIHQKLYQPETNATEIDMIVYLHELVNYLQESFGSGQRIQICTDFKPVRLDISLAVPVGLIMNEAITNAIKYAFPDEKKGRIIVAMEEIQPHRFLFSVTDDGRGLPVNLDINNIRTLGLKLMRGLSDDIAASFRIESKEGTRVSIEFTADNARVIART